ncbi:MAG: bifunctional oligoribonuclease/PAP phosphatase NrnA [Candidatus Hermodarchaeota archaeon]
MNISKRDETLKYLKGKNLLITSHDLVDLDGFISALALRFFFKNFYKNQKIKLIFSELSKQTKSFLENFSRKFPDFDFDFQLGKEILNIDVIVIVDTNNLDQIKLFDNLNLDIPFVFLDHHLNLQKNYPKNLLSLNLICDNYSSTSEVVLEFFEDYKINLPIPYRYLFISAILADSGFLKHGNNKTIKHLSNLVDDEVEIQDILPLLEKDRDISEKIAQIKALQRVKIIRINEWLVGISHLSSFTASAATLLTRIGFDVAIVITEEKTGFRITTRAKNQIRLKTGLHLGKIVSEIDDVSGGGHEGAATLNGRNDLDKTLNHLIDKIKKTLIK